MQNQNIKSGRQFFVILLFSCLFFSFTPKRFSYQSSDWNEWEDGKICRGTWYHVAPDGDLYGLAEADIRNNKDTCFLWCNKRIGDPNAGEVDGAYGRGCQWYEMDGVKNCRVGESEKCEVWSGGTILQCRGLKDSSVIYPPAAIDKSPNWAWVDGHRCPGQEQKKLNPSATARFDAFDLGLTTEKMGSADCLEWCAYVINNGTSSDREKYRTANGCQFSSSEKSCILFKKEYSADFDLATDADTSAPGVSCKFFPPTENPPPPRARAVGGKGASEPAKKDQVTQLAGKFDEIINDPAMASSIASLLDAVTAIKAKINAVRGTDYGENHCGKTTAITAPSEFLVKMVSDIPLAEDCQKSWCPVSTADIEELGQKARSLKSFNFPGKVQALTAWLEAVKGQMEKFSSCHSGITCPDLRNNPMADCTDKETNEPPCYFYCGD